MKIEGSWYKELKQSEAVGSFWTRGRKWNTVGALFVVSILTLGYVGGSGYLGYSDSDGSTAWTSTDNSFIIAGNNRYNGTFAGLQDAIESMNNATGKVTMPRVNISVATTLQLYDKVELDMNGAVLWGAADVNIIYMHPGSNLHGGTINVSGVVFTKECINISGIDDHSLFKRTTIEHMYFKSKDQQGYGIHFFIPDTAGDHQIGTNYFNDIRTYKFDTSYFFDNRWATVGTGGWINGNQFSNLFGYGDRCFINMSNTVHLGTVDTFTAIDGNVFTSIQYEPAVGVSDTFVSIDGDKNIFSDVIIWYDTTFLNASVFIRGGAGDNVLSGFFDNDIKNKGSYNTIYFNGIGGINNTRMCYDLGGTSGVRFYASTIGQPYTYFYGYDTGSSNVKAGMLQVSSSGTFYIRSDTGENIILSPSQGSNTHNVTIDDILKLDGRTTHPKGAVAGMIYYNSTTNLLMLYTAAWHSIDIT